MVQNSIDQSASYIKSFKIHRTTTAKMMSHVEIDYYARDGGPMDILVLYSF